MDKRQAASTLRCMQTLSRVQCQIRRRRIEMTKENQALQRQLLQKHAKELVNYKKMGEDVFLVLTRLGCGMVVRRARNRWLMRREPF